jgi:ATP-dependent phosphoenolpyruvate carboxykinase
MTADPTSPFRHATETDRRLKAMFWGDSGVGKTTLSLQFPDAVVIDMEEGTEHDSGAFTFDMPNTPTADEITQARDWLLSHPQRKEPA